MGHHIYEAPWAEHFHEEFELFSLKFASLWGSRTWQNWEMYYYRFLLAPESSKFKVEICSRSRQRLAFYIVYRFTSRGIFEESAIIGASWGMELAWGNSVLPTQLWLEHFSRVGLLIIIISYNYWSGGPRFTKARGFKEKMKLALLQRVGEKIFLKKSVW
jgi:hypothetical protein